MPISKQVQYNSAGVGFIALTNAKGSFESGKFTLKAVSESGKVLIIGCRLPPKSTHFGMLNAKL